ncbi:endonuclease/exonuclease/phosphatase family protein [Botrimarina hoheduenensis]|uniref:Endonuclease/Exonuclease/phosphatase family protein n=1 Tax=Botrimarina hoheduenensis TaxID=2528000 RepID=A0A5C5W770_9BACT|nr:endonuclease/exonuclease/phosphatase family protein [Botrimarina hoheduenensis]TWT46454.1 Endonuclease/Exonuclease/phosphatase family protein [Botrimarina hoheduenensis]
MHLTIPLRGLLLCFAALLPSGPAPAQTLSAVTFNLRGDFVEGRVTDQPHAWLATDGGHRRDRTVGLVQQLAPDLLGVQEAYANQLVDLRAALPAYADYGVGRDGPPTADRSAGEHCSIFYRKERFTALDQGTFWLSATPDRVSQHPEAGCRRIASWMILVDRLADRELFVLNTHWDHISAAARQEAAELIRNKLPTLAKDRPAIVMGDLNAVATDDSLQTLLDATGPTPLIDSYLAAHPESDGTERSFHGFAPQGDPWRIDYVLHSAALVTRDAQIIATPTEALAPSDHFPVRAVLSWRE